MKVENHFCEWEAEGNTTRGNLWQGMGAGGLATAHLRGEEEPVLGRVVRWAASAGDSAKPDLLRWPATLG